MYFDLIQTVHTLHTYMQVAFASGDFHKLQFFQRIVDAMMFEMLTSSKEVNISEHLKEFPPLDNTNPYDQIIKVYKNVSKPTHKISAILLHLYNNEEEMRNQIHNNQKHSDNEHDK